MIYTVTFNPAIDYIMTAEDLLLGETNRSKGEQILFGGKGINVSAVLKNLGAPSRALGFVAGFTGDALEDAIKKEGIDADFIHLKEGNTRINVKLKGKSETEINASGPHINEAEFKELLKKLSALKEGDTLILSGSANCYLGKGTYAEILDGLKGKNIRFAVDAAGELLKNTLKFSPFLIKPNLSELCELSGRSLKEKDEIISAAKQLQKEGAQNVLVSLSHKGAILVTASGEVYCEGGIKGKAVNSVGAGDSMLAAFIFYYDKGEQFALKAANAAGAACAFSVTLPTKKEIEKLI